MTAIATTRSLRGLPSFGNAPVVRLENVYNMDETGILPNAPTSLKVLTDRDDTRTYRGASIQRVLVTAIECVLADGRSPRPHDHIACGEPSEDLDHVCNSQMALRVQRVQLHRL